MITSVDEPRPEKFSWLQYVEQLNKDTAQGRLSCVRNFATGFFIMIAAHLEAAFSKKPYPDCFRSYWNQMPAVLPEAPASDPLETKRYSYKKIALGIVGAIALAYLLWQSGALHSIFGNKPDSSDVKFDPAVPSEIKIFTSYTKDNSERLEMSKKVMKSQMEYCKKQGYHFEAYEQNLAYISMFDYSLPYWSKIAGINRILNEDSKESGWIVWMDDDAVVLNGSIRMEEFIRDHGGSDPETHVIVTSDVPHASTALNTGVLIVRKSEKSKLFFKELWDMRHQPIYKNGRSSRYSQCPNQICLHEQEAMHDLLEMKPEYKEFVKIIPQTDAHGVGINTFK
jgi:hypothetical protein